MHERNLAIARCLGKEAGIDVNNAGQEGVTPLYIAAQKGHLDVVRCLIGVLGADANQARKNGVTPLMVAANMKDQKVIAYLLKHGADPQHSHPEYGTAADFSKYFGYPDEQTAYLQAKTHCSKPGCAGAGHKKCTSCKQARCCGQQCQLAHWPAHKAECKEAAKNEPEKRD
jgi:hypothetical protein